MKSFCKSEAQASSFATGKGSLNKLLQVYAQAIKIIAGRGNSAGAGSR